MPQSGEILERFIETLVQEIAVTRPEYLTAPFTIAEIYQDLVPYRSHRALIGVEMNGDYEEALLQMLSGEGDCLLLDSAVARQEMQDELASPNPNTSLFHDFAAADVRLHPGRVPLDVGRGSEGAAEEAAVEAVEVSEADLVDPGVERELEAERKLEAERQLEVERELEAERQLEVERELEAERQESASEETPPKAAEVGGGGPPVPATPEGLEQVELVRAEPAGSGEDGVVGHIKTASAPSMASFKEPAPDGNGATDTESNDVLTVCHWCRETLPVRDSVHFCPFCGSDLRPSPCRECGEAMEARWQFCVSCGVDVRD